MSNLPEGVLKYLSKYSLPKWKLEFNAPLNIESVIVVPALSEYYDIQELLESLLKNDNKYFSSTLVIFVINNTAQSGDEIKRDNRNSIENIRNIINHKIDSGFTKKIISSGLNFGLVDASTKGNEFPVKEAGAGLAIIDNFNNKNLSAAVIKFEHRIVEPETTAAIICYEIFLRYYILGLKLADSPFAFHTVGSSMAFDIGTYISAGGMNKRKAGEDFYFLEKIAKRKRIEKIDSTAVYPSSRISWRVPFGTGPRIKRFISRIQDEYLLYDPESFIILKNWLEEFNKPVILSSEKYLKIAGNIHPDLYQFLVINNFENSWDKILNNSKSLTQLEKQKLFWFDGFRTLKLIHYLRDNSFPLIDMFDALDLILSYFDSGPGFKRRRGINPRINEQVEYLTILRKLS
ncbi:MAG: hypothetical protein P8Z35_23150 [Ignavibacteriaceae bacterium]